MHPRRASLPSPIRELPAEAGSLDLTYIDIGQKIPGYRTSAAFFKSLRANLRLIEGSSSPLLSPRSESPSLQALEINTYNNVHESYVNSDSDVIHPPSPYLLAKDSKQKPKPRTGSSLIQPKSPLRPPLQKAKPTASTATFKPTTVRIHSVVQPHLYWTTSRRDITSALSLVASTVSDQRRLAFQALLIHPLNLLFYILLLYVVQKSIQCISHVLAVRAKTKGQGGTSASNQWPIVCLSWLGLSVAALAIVYFLTLPYTRVAKGLSNSFHSNGTQDNDHPLNKDVIYAPDARDELLVAVLQEPKSGPALDADTDIAVTTEPQDIVVGSLVLNWVPGATPGKSKRRKSTGGKAYVKAWAVNKEWRGCGVGSALLNEAVRITLRERGGDAIIFSDTHAHSQRVLPAFYNGLFDRRDRRARLALARAFEATSRSKSNRKR